MPTREEMLVEAERRGILDEKTTKLLAEARRRGLVKSESAVDKVIGAASAVGQGVNVGLTDILGAPVDLATAALNLIPGMDIQDPVGGSAQMRRGLAATRMGFENIEDVPQDVRPFAQGGRVVGQSVPIAAAPLAAARAGVQGGRMIQPIMEAARTAPGGFAVAEAGSTAGAGIASGVAERVAPGNEALRTGAEVAGGFVSPIAILGRAVVKSGGFINRIRSIFSQTGREVAVGQRVRDLLEESGESFEGVVSRLESPETIEGARMTAGQKADSPTLLALQRRIVKNIPGVDNEIRQMIDRTTVALNRGFDLAVESGDPNLIVQVSRERERWFRSLLEARVSAARQKAQETAGTLAPGRSREDVSLRVRESLESALEDARAGERALWGSVQRDIPLEPGATNDAYLGVRSELLEEESLPAPVEAFMKRVRSSLDPQGEIVEITSGDLLRFRSRLLAMQRKARADNDPDLARKLGELADGVLNDLSGIPGADEARAFSKGLNDLFTRGETGRLLGFDARGGARVEPELTLQRSVGRGGQSGAVASRQIESAAQLEGLPGELPRRTTLPEQEDFVRSLFVKAVNPQTGEVNPQVLARLARDNAELLDKFPGLKNAVSDARTAQVFTARVAEQQGRSVKAVQQRAAFSKVAGFDDPQRAIANVLSGPQPLRHYGEIARIARDSGENVTAGLRRATFDHLFESATDGTTGLISGKILREALERPIGQRSLLQVMLDEKVLTRDRAKNLAAVIDRAERFETALKNQDRIDEMIEGAGTLEDLFIRIIGANIGGQGAVGGSVGTPLVAAQAGSKAARRIAEKIPAFKTERILAEAIEDPALMVRLLKKSRNRNFKIGMKRRINAFLLQTAVPDDDETRQEQFEDLLSGGVARRFLLGP